VSDAAAPRFPVSVKGVVLHGGRVVLLRNQRQEWELPGGKLEPRESPEACLVREVREELGLRITPGPVLDAWVYTVPPGVEVVIVTYGCHVEPFDDLAASPEHEAVGLFELDRLAALPMPEGYRRSIRAWAAAYGPK
jgi:8-oxo-dGTP pyrophosphatase MutT (NUDIX family)